jgi:hypothetical protein
LCLPAELSSRQARGQAAAGKGGKSPAAERGQKRPQQLPEEDDEEELLYEEGEEYEEYEEGEDVELLEDGEDLVGGGVQCYSNATSMRLRFSMHRLLCRTLQAAAATVHVQPRPARDAAGRALLACYCYRESTWRRA